MPGRSNPVPDPASGMWGEALGRAVNGMLHDAMGLPPCDTACTHVIIDTPKQGWWTALGVANCLRRIVDALED